MAYRAHDDQTYRLLSTALDADFYLSVYRHRLDPGMDPLAHYIGVGWREGADPAPWFSTHDYLATHVDVAKADVNPLAHYLLNKATDKRERAFLINRMLDSMRGTIIRQTMFAEFEKRIHELVENGEPLTVDTLRTEYRKLLEAYFGPNFTIDEQLSLECLRIPHFYRGFYVYKYATGMSAAIALSQRILNGGQREREDYLNFLKGGSSKWPLELLRGAGVDMSRPEPVDTALRQFERLVAELDELLK
jgi:oligoendopeptidase F